MLSQTMLLNTFRVSLSRAFWGGFTLKFKYMHMYVCTCMQTHVYTDKCTLMLYCIGACKHMCHAHVCMQMCMGSMWTCMCLQTHTDVLARKCTLQCTCRHGLHMYIHAYYALHIRTCVLCTCMHAQIYMCHMPMPHAHMYINAKIHAVCTYVCTCTQICTHYIYIYMYTRMHAHTHTFLQVRYEQQF